MNAKLIKSRKNVQNLKKGKLINLLLIELKGSAFEAILVLHR